MNWLHTHIQRLATWPVVALLLCGCVLCTACFDKVQESLGHQNQILDKRGWYTPQDVEELYGGLGAGRTLYVTSALTTDVVFPVLYGLLLSVLVVRLYSFEHRYLILIPIAAAVADLLENSTIAVLMLSGPSSLSWLAAGLTAGKFGLLLVSLVVVAVGGIVGLRRAD